MYTGVATGVATAMDDGTLVMILSMGPRAWLGLGLGLQGWVMVMVRARVRAS